MKSFIQHIQFGDDCKPHNEAHIGFDVDPFGLPEGTVLSQEDEGIVLMAYDSAPRYDKNVISKNYDPNTIQFLSNIDIDLADYVVFNEDGTRLVTASENGVGVESSLREYTLSTAWDVSTATLDNEFNPPEVLEDSDEIPHIMIAGGDNQTLYVTLQDASTGGVSLLRYSLTAPFDISSPTLQETEDVERAAADGFPFYSDFKFNEDGTKVFTVPSGNASTDLITEYNLSTPWRFSSRSTVSSIPESALPDGLTGSPQAFAFLGDGSHLLINAGNPGAIKFRLTTPYDLSTWDRVLTNDPFSPESPQLRSLWETPLIEPFPSDPQYMKIEVEDINVFDIVVRIAYYNFDDIIELKAYADGVLLEEGIRADSEEYTFSGLSAGLFYDLKIEAITYADVVSLTDTVTAQTQSDQLTFTQESNTETSVTLSWTNDYDDIAGYNLLLEGVQDNGAVITLAEAQAGYLIDGLSAGTQYDITVEALDASDNLLFTDSTSITTQAQALNSLNDDFESYSLGAVPANWVQSTGSDASWLVTDQRAAGGSQSLGSEEITHNETAAIELTLDLAAENTLSFDYLPSCENNFDFFRFYIDGVQEFEQSGEFNQDPSGDTLTFFNHSQVLAAGTYTLKFEFAKDGSADEYDDRCYIDNITTTPT